MRAGVIAAQRDIHLVKQGAQQLDACRLGGHVRGGPGFHAEVCRSVQDGDTTWTEWRWSGTRSDEQAFEMRGVTLFEITDDQTVAGRLYLEEIEREVASIEQAVEVLSGRRARPAQQ